MGVKCVLSSLSLLEASHVLTIAPYDSARRVSSRRSRSSRPSRLGARDRTKARLRLLARPLPWARSSLKRRPGRTPKIGSDSESPAGSSPCSTSSEGQRRWTSTSATRSLASAANSASFLHAFPQFSNTRSLTNLFSIFSVLQRRCRASRPTPGLARPSPTRGRCRRLRRLQRPSGSMDGHPRSQRPLLWREQGRRPLLRRSALCTRGERLLMRIEGDECECPSLILPPV